MAKCCDGTGPNLVCPTGPAGPRCLELSRRLFDAAFWPALQAALPDLAPRMAVGLVGNGSECLGYDDDISRDHDWGVTFRVWLPEADRPRVGEIEDVRERLLASLPDDLRPAPSRYGGAPGVSTVDDFYRGLLGCPKGPRTVGEWRAVPEENLALATNGAVFVDGAGEFGAVRGRLLEHYPEDIRLKKMAARCMEIAQTGQYNLRRMGARRDWVCVQDVLARFTTAAEGLVFLLNRTYRPYYKWAWRALRDLPEGGAEVAAQLRTLAEVQGWDGMAIERRAGVATRVCETLARLMREQGLVEPPDEPDAFFTTYAEQLRARIGNAGLRALPPQYE